MNRAFAVGVLAFCVACGGDDDNSNNNQNTVTGPITCEGDVCTVTGSLTENTTFTADKQWVLNGGVFVGDDGSDVTLTLEPGTTVYGSSSSLSFLVVTRGAKINADGTAENPIVFTSSKAVGSRARGDWGGVIINGRAPLNNCTDGVCESEGEGGTGKYGGDQPGDNSGVLRYVRVEFAGQLISPDNELNGIAFQGVGSGTTIDYVQVHMNKDDGIEFFGGTANFKHVIVTGIGDDSLDWTDGWQGKGQFFVAQQFEDNGDNGIEADNNGDDNAASPRSNPTLSNLTIVGAPDGAGSDVGVLLREGTGANISNIIVQGFNEGCVDIDNEETFVNGWESDALSGDLVMTNAILHCNAIDSEVPDAIDDEDDFTPPFTVSDFVNTLNEGNQIVDPMLDGYIPASGSPALSGGVAPSDSFFESVDFIGAIGTDDWTAGWTTSERN